jgi:uncharacterized protein (UPF0333 family)
MTMRDAGCGMRDEIRQSRIPHSALRMGKRGQSTLEYLLVAVAVLLAAVFGARAFIQPNTETRMEEAGDLMNRAGSAFVAATQ